MTFNKPITGVTTRLESVKISDAEFIFLLRSNPEISKYLNISVDSIEKQREWIVEQKGRKSDYYFLIKNLDGISRGTISLYNIDGSVTAEFGRWICIGSMLNSTESVILLHDFGFNTLGISKIISKTISDNKSVINFHKRFGAELVNDSLIENGIQFTIYQIEQCNYQRIREKNLKLIRQLA